MNLRDSYPIGKCTSENLCQAYSHERGISVDVLRLSQAIGTTCPVRKSHDTRIVMEIARDILSGSDIVLKTKGESRREQANLYLCGGCCDSDPEGADMRGF